MPSSIFGSAPPNADATRFARSSGGSTATGPSGSGGASSRCGRKKRATITRIRKPAPSQINRVSSGLLRSVGGGAGSRKLGRPDPAGLVPPPIAGPPPAGGGGHEPGVGSPLEELMSGSAIASSATGSLPRAERELDAIDVLALAEVHHGHDLVPRHLGVGVDRDGRVGLAGALPGGLALAEEALQLVVVLHPAAAEHAVHLARLLVPEERDAHLLERVGQRARVAEPLVAREPRIELAFDLLELERAHEEDAEAEDHVDHRHDVDGDRVFFLVL